MDSLEAIAANSYRNFHAKGLDYLCLLRTPELTRKVYFFDGDVSKLPEIVTPHDHRYDFKTTVLAGMVANRFYAKNVRGGEPVERFDYMTPLNGGDGFTWRETVTLRCTADRTFERGQSYSCRADQIHTLKIHSDSCVIVLDQYADSVAMDQPTSAYRADATAPNLDGLYERMTEDHLQDRLRQAVNLMRQL